MVASSKANPRVVVVGSANVDLTCFTDRFPNPGETMFGERFHLGFGGKGANQAVAASYCGVDVHMVARVGDDLFGPATIDNFGARGIDAEYVLAVPGVSSGVAPIFVDSGGENRIIVAKGANNELTPKAVELAIPLLKTADMLILQLEIPMETVIYSIGLASDLGLRCILNPAPACPIDLTAIKSVDYLIPNETEASALTGLPVDTLEQAEACAKVLLARGLRRVILTLGARGSLIAGPTGIQRVPAFDVHPKDTSGAGDAFIGSFAAFLCEGLPELDAIARANLYAGLSTTSVGTQTSFVRRSQFDHEWSRRVSVS